MVRNHRDLDPKIQELIHEAKKAREQAYSPYYKHPVGVALLAKSGKTYRGCNVENCAGSGACAEANALGAAVVAGDREFTALALIGPGKSFLVPCGVCRQKLSEFADELTIYSAKDNGEVEELQLSALFPYPMKL